MKPLFTLPKAALAALVLTGLIRPAHAVAPHSITDGEFAQFAQGELQSAALTSDGFLIPSYARKKIADSGAEIIWDAVREGSGSYLCATGHSGQLIRIDDKGTTKSIAKTGDKELTAMVRLADGSTLVAGAPSGRIYRLGSDDKLTTATRIHAGIVWRMTLDAKGDVWAATGPEGRLFRLHPSGDKVDAVEVAKLNSSNLLGLWIDKDGKMGKAGELYIAGQDPGWVYRATADGKQVDVIYNAQAEEVRAIAPFAEGLALALNTERAPTSQALGLAIRVAGGGISAANAAQQPPPPPTPPPGAGSDPQSAAALNQAFAPSRRPGGGFGAPRSEIVVLSKEGFVRNLWPAQDRPIHDMAPSPSGGLLASAGNEGRLFEVQPDGTSAVVADTREDYLLRIVADDKGYLIGAARNGVLYTMDRKRADEAVFLSRALDARLPVTWGHFYLRGDLARGQRIRVAFRTGNDGDLDSKFWSAWSDDKTVELDQPVEPPAGTARFLQYRLKIGGGEVDGVPPRVDETEQFYIEPNAAPLIRAVEVQDVSETRRPSAARGSSAPGGGAPPPPPSSGGTSNSINIPTSGSAPAGSRGSGASDNDRDARSNGMQFRISWQAADPNGDELRFALYFKGEGEKEWKLIDKELTQANMTVDIGGVADGRYRFRVVASDELSNPPGKELKTEKVSDAITVDNTPPVIDSLTASVSGARATIRAGATDELSVLSTAKLDIDNGDGLPLLPVDGLMDERSEKFEFQTEELKPGEHVATLVATDRRGNSSVKKTVFTVDKP